MPFSLCMHALVSHNGELLWTFINLCETVLLESCTLHKIRKCTISIYFYVSEFQLRMAALNEPYSGDMHGVRGADHACYRQAQRANMRGTFRAFISSRVQDLDSIVRPADRNLPVINTRVRYFFKAYLI